MIGGRSLMALVLVAVLTAGAAWMVASRGAGGGDVRSGEFFLPGLSERINDVQRLTVVGPEESFEVHRSEQGWVMDDKGDHPARFETVKGTLMALAGLQRVEPKTDSPDLYTRLGVEDPGQSGATSTRVTAVGEDGQVLADLILGKPGTSPGTRYVRTPGEGRSWQVRGDLSVDPRAVGWLETTIVELPAARVRSVSIQHADGEVVRVSKQAADDVSWELEDVPQGREPIHGTIGRTLAGAFERLELDDVASAASRLLPETDPVQTVVETFDGLRITVRSAKAAARDAAGGADVAGAADDEGRVWVALAVEILPEAADDVRAEGEALQARVEPWTFAVSAYRGANLRKHMQDLTREASLPEDALPEDALPEDALPEDAPVDAGTDEPRR